MPAAAAMSRMRSCLRKPRRISATARLTWLRWLSADHHPTPILEAMNSLAKLHIPVSCYLFLARLAPELSLGLNGQDKESVIKTQMRASRRSHVLRDNLQCDSRRTNGEFGATRKHGRVDRHVGASPSALGPSDQRIGTAGCTILAGDLGQASKINSLNTGWLGRQDSNLRMAASKAAIRVFALLSATLKAAEICGFPYYTKSRDPVESKS